MHQVAELMAAERVIAQVLYDRASVGVGVSFFQLIVSDARVAVTEQRHDLVFPEHVHDLFVREHGVGVGKRHSAKQQQKCGDELKCAS